MINGAVNTHNGWNNNFKRTPGWLTYTNWFNGFNAETVTGETKNQQEGGGQSFESLIVEA